MSFMLRYELLLYSDELDISQKSTESFTKGTLKVAQPKLYAYSL